MNFAGVFSPIPTPFDDRDRVDTTRLKAALAKWVKKPGVRTSTASAPCSAARLVALIAPCVDSRPVPTMKRFSDGTASRAATIAWSDSKSSISTASPFDPRTTKPCSGR